MSDDSKKEQQMKNKNGRSTLVLSTQNLQDISDKSADSSKYIGYLATGTKIFEKNNFSWGIFHSKTTPPLSLERLKKIKDIKVYSYNHNTNRVFNGNQHTSVTNIGKVADKFDNVSGKLGNVGDIAEVAVAIREKDKTKLATKTSTMILSKASEHATLALAGKCTQTIAKRTVDPRKIAIAGATCLLATEWLKDHAIDAAGDKIGSTSTAQKAAQGVFDAIDIIDKQDQKAAERQKQEDLKKDPMSMWNVISSD